MGLKFSSSPTFSFFRFLSLHYFGLFFTLLLFLFVLFRSPLCVVLVSFLRCFILLFLVLYSPLCAIFSSSHCQALHFTLLSSPPHVVGFSSSHYFVLLSFSLRFYFHFRIVFLFGCSLLQLLSYFKYKFFVLLLFSSCCYFSCFVIL